MAHWQLIVVVFGAILALALLKRAGLVSAKKARALLQQNARVVDVRTPQEFDARRLPSAVNIPLDQLAHQAPRQFPDRQQVILVHCLSGTRSGMARSQLRQMGYTNVFNLGSFTRAKNILGA